MTTELAKTDNIIAGEFLKKFGKSLNEYAIRKYNQSAFLKSAMIAIVDNKELAEAVKTDKGKTSVFNALRYAATTGLSLNPQEGKAALIAYKNKTGETTVNYQIMKNGMIDLAMESGKVEFITADYVRENDKFDLKKSVHGDEYTFIPAIKDRGELLGFYAALKMKNGSTHVKWLTFEEVCEIRDKYSNAHYRYDDKNGQFKKGEIIPDSAWGKSFIGMGVKTVMKALLRNISISNELDNAIGADDFFEADFRIEPNTGVTPEDVKTKLTEPVESPKEEEVQGDLL